MSDWTGIRYRGGFNHKPLNFGTPSLSAFTDRESILIPTVPPQGWEYAVPDQARSILGNDKYGCCEEAAIYHYAQNVSYNVGHPLNPTTAQCLELYSAVTGFDIANPSTDNGTYPQQMLDYVLKNGMPINDAHGKEVKWEIVAYAAVDITNPTLMRWASYTFGGMIFNFNCPRSAEENVSNWLYVPGSPTIGGHGTNIAGEGALGWHIDSWGMCIPTSKMFTRVYAVSAFAIATKFWVNSLDKSPTGFDLDGLLNEMSVYLKTVV